MAEPISILAILGKGLKKGFNFVIMEETIIGDNVTLGNNVVIYPYTRIANGAQVLDNAVIGKPPANVSTLTRKTDTPLPPCEIGENSIVGTSAIIYGGTKIGKNCLIADLSSIREKCIIKDNVIIVEQ